MFQSAEPSTCSTESISTLFLRFLLGKPRTMIAKVKCAHARAAVERRLLARQISREEAHSIPNDFSTNQ